MFFLAIRLTLIVILRHIRYQRKLPLRLQRIHQPKLEQQRIRLIPAHDIQPQYILQNLHLPLILRLLIIERRALPLLLSTLAGHFALDGPELHFERGGLFPNFLEGRLEVRYGRLEVGMCVSLRFER